MTRRRGLVALLALLAVGVACSDPEPPNPDAAVTTSTASPPEADDPTLDALEEEYEDRGVKDIRADDGGAVTIRLEDELTVADAAPACAAVRAAGFTDVSVDVDGVVAPCP